MTDSEISALTPEQARVTHHTLQGYQAGLCYSRMSDADRALANRLDHDMWKVRAIFGFEAFTTRELASRAGWSLRRAQRAAQGLVYFGRAFRYRTAIKIKATHDRV